MADYEHPELKNLAPELDEEEVQELGQVCLEEYKQDYESGAEWRDMHAEWLKLYFQKDTPKNPPWEASSSESVPMLAEACTQFHARALKALFPSRDIIQAIPTGKKSPADKERAKRVATHMSWQLMVKDKKYKRNKDRLLLSLPLHGSFFTKTYRAGNRNVVDNVRAVDLVVPYGTGPRDIEDLPRKTHRYYLPMWRCRYLHADGFFSEMPEPYDLGEKSEVDYAHDDVMGFHQTGYRPTDEALILEQHRFYDLDGDGLEEPYIVWVDVQSERVLRVAIRYDTDEAGNPTDNKEPVEYFTHYPFLENPDGFYGLGYGHLIGQLNIAVNKLIRQTVDAGTLANVGNMSGFVSSTLAAKKGTLEFQLGKFTKTESSVEDLSKGIYQFKFPGPQPVLASVAEMLMSRSDRLATVTEAITGQTEKVMQPTTVMALIEQSLEVFSSAYERVLGATEDELSKVYRLNGKFMDPEEYFAVLDVDGQLQDMTASREDYEDDLQIKPIADPKLSTQKQIMAKAEAEYQALAQNPLVLQSPPHFYNATKRYLRAMGTEDIDEVLPNPSQLPRVDEPAMENVMTLMPVPMVPAAFPDQDHIMHMKVHMSLLNDPMYSARISAEGRAAMEEHLQAHIAFMYGQTENGLDQSPADAGIQGASVEAEPAVPAGMAAPGVMGQGQPAQGPTNGSGGDIGGGP